MNQDLWAFIGMLFFLVVGFVVGVRYGVDCERQRQLHQIREGMERITFWLRRPATGKRHQVDREKPIVFLRKWAAN